MVYTQSDGLRDREYSKFSAGQSVGSVTVVNTNNLVKQYTFPYSDAVGETISEYTSISLNGELKGVIIHENNYTATGSLFLRISGCEETVWSMISGTARGIGVGASGLTVPLYETYRPNSSIISGTSATSIYKPVSMDSVLHLVGTKVGANKSGAVTILYK